MYIQELNGQRDVVFIAGIRNYSHAAFINIAQSNIQTKGFLAITNCRQADAEQLLQKEGWELLHHSEKNHHVRQREKYTEYLKLWYMPMEKLNLNIDAIKQRIEEFKKDPDYAFLTWSKSYRRKILKDNGNDTSSSYMRVVNNLKGTYGGTTSMYPFLATSVPRPSLKEDIKTFHKHLFGTYIPPINPMTGKIFQNLTDCVNFVRSVKQGVI